jgi:NAD(P)-dependent dehydrogenase (short-subunit alcohol dehydrogenase family)
MTNLNGTIALVVGGASGIGLGIAKALAGEGCKIAITDYNEKLLQSTAKSPDFKQPPECKVCDVTDRRQVEQLFKWLDQKVGSIDILVNSAGINVANRMMADIDPADFDRVLAVNTTGTFNCIYQAVPRMRKKHSGLIVNIVSMAGRRAMLLAGLPYCASKFAASAIGMCVNLEECGNGIKVTNIYPGEANTPLIDKRPNPPSAEVRAAMLQPEDIAACVVTIAKLPPRAIVPELVITPPHMMIP